MAQKLTLPELTPDLAAAPQGFCRDPRCAVADRRGGDGSDPPRLRRGPAGPGRPRPQPQGRGGCPRRCSGFCGRAASTPSTAGCLCIRTSAAHACGQALRRPDPPSVLRRRHEAQVQTAPSGNGALGQAARSGAVVESFGAAVELAREHREGKRCTRILRRDVHLVRFAPCQIDVRLTDDAPRSLPNDLAAFLSRITEQRWVVSVATARSRPSQRCSNRKTDAAANARCRRRGTPPGQRRFWRSSPAPTSKRSAICAPAGPRPMIPSGARQTQRRTESPKRMKNLGQNDETGAGDTDQDVGGPGRPRAGRDHRRVGRWHGPGDVERQGEMRGLTIDDSLMTLSEREVLEDLIVAAHNDAKTKSNVTSLKRWAS